MSLRRKDQLINLISGYIREIEKDFSQIIPREINKLLFEYYYNPFIWKQDGFHGDSIIFVDEHTIKTKEMGQTGIAVVDSIIDGDYVDTFDWKVIIKNLDGLITIGLFGVNDDNNPDIKTKDDKLYNEQIHILNGASIAVYTGYDHSWTTIDSRFAKQNGITTNRQKLKYPNGELKHNLCNIEIGVKFDMKQHKMNVYYNDIFIGTAFKKIPNKVIPAICMYPRCRNTHKSTVIIKQEEIIRSDKQNK